MSITTALIKKEKEANETAYSDMKKIKLRNVKKEDKLKEKTVLREKEKFMQLQFSLQEKLIIFFKLYILQSELSYFNTFFLIAHKKVFKLKNVNIYLFKHVFI